MFRDDHDGPELHVPDEALRKPRGAAVGDDGTVACVTCQQRIPLAAADVVGQGYRCAPCGHEAHVAALRSGENVDAGAHLSPGARADLRRHGQQLLVGGIALIAVGVILIGVLLASDIDPKLGVVVVAAGGGLAATGSMKKHAAG